MSLKRENMKISFCTQIYNRFWQLSQLLKINIEQIENTIHEWIIVDFSSTDGIDIPDHPNIRYIKQPQIHPYDIPKAKNIALGYATGDYIVSLDADNSIDNWIDLIHSYPSYPIHNWSGVYLDGSFGRIGAPACCWSNVGYFDEACRAGYHDEVILKKFDLISRTIKIPFKGQVIQNTKEQTMANIFVQWEIEREKGKEIILKEFPIPKIKIDLPANTWGYKKGYSKRVMLGNVKETTLKFNASFSKDFDFGKGGKLPGIGGGTIPHGGRYSKKGFSARFMFRAGGEIELYVYHEHQKGKYGDSFILGTIKDLSNNHFKLHFKEGKLIAMVNNYKLELDVGFDSCSCIFLDVFRGGNDESWSVKTNSSIVIN